MSWQSATLLGNWKHALETVETSRELGLLLGNWGLSKDGRIFEKLMDKINWYSLWSVTSAAINVI